MRNIFTYYTLIFFSYISTCSLSSEFVTVKDTQLYLDSKPYKFMGTNFWYGPNLASKGKGGNRTRLISELDSLQKIGVKNLRILGVSQGPKTEPWRIKPALEEIPGSYNPDILDGLDFLLSEMKKRSMKAVIYIGNFWGWSGGFPQEFKWAGGGTIPFPAPRGTSTWSKYCEYISQFYNNATAVEYYYNNIRELLGHRNVYMEGSPKYSEDPTIMSWELANEPEPYKTEYKTTYLEWVKKSLELIKSLAPKQLRSIGNSGFRSDIYYEESTGMADYATVHVWVQNSGWYDPKKPSTFDSAVEKAHIYLEQMLEMSKSLNKPLILEEFGLARDNESYTPNTPTIYKDKFYNISFSWCLEGIKKGVVSGANFWAWAGEGRPRVPGGWWEEGDPWMGDPPHEPQGWYSVYDTDIGTIAVISAFAKFFEGGTPGSVLDPYHWHLYMTALVVVASVLGVSLIGFVIFYLLKKRKVGNYIDLLDEQTMTPR